MFYGPLGGGIGRNVTGWHCRRMSTLNNISGARTRTTYVFQVGGVLFVKFFSTTDYRGVTNLVREAGVVRKACFLALNVYLVHSK